MSDKLQSDKLQFVDGAGIVDKLKYVGHAETAGALKSMSE
jgi:hypothetical protein